MASQLSFVEGLNRWDHRSPHSWTWLLDTTRHRSRQHLKPFKIISTDYCSGSQRLTETYLYVKNGLSFIPWSQRTIHPLPLKAQHDMNELFHQRQQVTYSSSLSPIFQHLAKWQGPKYIFTFLLVSMSFHSFFTFIKFGQRCKMSL